MPAKQLALGNKCVCGLTFNHEKGCLNLVEKAVAMLAHGIPV